VGPTIVARDDLEILVAGASVAVFVLNASVGKMHLLVAVR
jgi:hypothetical protein